MPSPAKGAAEHRAAPPGPSPPAKPPAVPPKRAPPRAAHGAGLDARVHAFETLQAFALGWRARRVLRTPRAVDVARQARDIKALVADLDPNSADDGVLAVRLWSDVLRHVDDLVKLCSEPVVLSNPRVVPQSAPGQRQSSAAPRASAGGAKVTARPASGPPMRAAATHGSGRQFLRRKSLKGPPPTGKVDWSHVGARTRCGAVTAAPQSTAPSRREPAAPEPEGRATPVPGAQQPLQEAHEPAGEPAQGRSNETSPPRGAGSDRPDDAGTGDGPSVEELEDWCDTLVGQIGEDLDDTDARRREAIARGSRVPQIDGGSAFWRPGSQGLGGRDPQLG